MIRKRIAAVAMRIIYLLLLIYEGGAFNSKKFLHLELR